MCVGPAKRRCVRRVIGPHGGFDVGGLGHGAVKAVGEGISELRIDHGPGYRVYFVQKDNTYVVLLAGGDKSTQDKDIRQAKALARDL